MFGFDRSHYAIVAALLLGGCGEGFVDPERGLATDGSTLEGALTVNEWRAGRSGFIELFNSSDVGIDLTGWAVDDGPGGAAKRSLESGAFVNPHDFFLVPYGGINASSADRVRLLDPSGVVVADHANGYDGRSLSGRCFGRAPGSAAPVVRAGPVLDRAIPCTEGFANWVDATRLLINEVRPGSPGYVEIYNPEAYWVSTETQSATDPQGEPMWLQIEGREPHGVRLDVAPGGVAVVALLLTTERPVAISLQTAAGVELDAATSAVGGGPIAGRCFGRVTDGGAWAPGPVPCSSGVSNFVPGYDLVVNELKTGSAGFIEIYNRGATEADLSGYAVDDVEAAGSAPKRLVAGTKLAPGAFLLVPYGGVNKSSADWARIIDAAGAPVDAISTAAWGDRTSGCLGRSPDGGDWAFASRSCSPGEPNGVPVTPSGTCRATGGTYETIPFTAEQECKALEYLNKARFSELGRLADLSRNIAYDCGPAGCLAYRQAAWTSVLDYAGTPYVSGSTPGPTTLRKLLEASSTWQDDGLPYDTIANTWAHRGELVGRRVTLEKIWIERLDPANELCVVGRDAPDAPNFLYLCEVPSFCHDGCSPVDSLRTHVGEWIWLRGLLSNSDWVRGGAWAIHDPTVRAANPAIP